MLTLQRTRIRYPNYSYHGGGTGGGGGGGAPTDASYLTSSAESGLSNEKVFGSVVFYPPDILANRPSAAATIIGAIYFATDAGGSAGLGALYRSDGVSTWERIAIDKEYADSLYSGAFQPLDADLTDIAAITRARGDLIVGGASNWVDLTVGASGTILGSNGTDPSWMTPTTAGVQPLDATLTALAGVTTAADKLIYATGSDVFTTTDLSSFIRTLLDDANQATAQSTLGLVPGTNVQAWDAELQAIAGLTSAADKLPYFTGSGTAALSDFAALGRSFAGAIWRGYSNIDQTIPTGTFVAAQIGTMTAPHTFTLPAANSYTSGQLLFVADTSGTVTTTNTLTVARAGSDLISGATTKVIDIAYGVLVLGSDGISKWNVLGDHGSLAGLTHDDHLQYANINAQRTGSQTFQFSSSSAADTTYQTTSHATKGKHIFGSAGIFGDQAVALASSFAAKGFAIGGVPSAGTPLTSSQSTDFFAMSVWHNYYQDQLTTTNATPTVGVTIPIPTQSVNLIEVRVLARKTDETAAAVYVKRFTCRRDTTTTVTALTGTNQQTYGSDNEDNASYDAALTISTTNVVLTVTGVAATNIEWAFFTDHYYNQDI